MENRIIESVRRFGNEPGAIYQLEWRACGKSRCRCSIGLLHGPYWYRYQWSKRKLRLVSSYVGRELNRKGEKKKNGNEEKKATKAKRGGSRKAHED